MEFPLIMLPLHVLFMVLQKASPLVMFRLARCKKQLFSMVEKYHPQSYLVELEGFCVTSKPNGLGVFSHGGDRSVLHMVRSPPFWTGLSQVRFGTLFLRGGSIDLLASQQIVCTVLSVRELFLADVLAVRPLVNATTLKFMVDEPVLHTEVDMINLSAPIFYDFPEILIDGHLPTFSPRDAPTTCEHLRFVCSSSPVIPDNVVVEEILRILWDTAEANLGLDVHFLLSPHLFNMVSLGCNLRNVFFGYEKKGKTTMWTSYVKVGQTFVYFWCHNSVLHDGYFVFNARRFVP